MGESFEKTAIEKFREFIRINTVQPNPDYASAVVFFKEYAKELDLEFKTFEAVKGKPVILLLMKGSDAGLPCILLNSHMDVVPVFEEHWTYPPFSAHMDKQGNIYGRGTQDMKCVTIQYLEAIRLLRKDGFIPRRNIYLSIVPDEEIGGEDGMGAFVTSKEFTDLNVGFALDEGLASETDVYKMYYAERKAYWVDITCRGKPGHGSLLIENTAVDKMRKVIDVFMGYRDECVKRAEQEKLSLGSRRTINLTILNGGVQINVVPPQFNISFDMRMLPEDNGKEMVEALVRKTGVDVEVKFFQEGSKKVLVTDTTDANIFFKDMKDVFKQRGLKYDLEVFVGGTDSRYLRDLDIPAIGFSPMIHTKVLLHDHNENLNCKVFTNGISLYKPIITAIANC